MKPSLVFGGWAVLGLLLAATLAAAATLDRRAWPAFVGDEATYLMQAQSLAWDFDLEYTRQDYDRFVALWGRPPDGLILQSADGGSTLVYGKPAAYPLFIAPFVRLSPTRGPAVANALLLAVAAVAAGRALQRRIGEAAPLWIAAWVFGSVSFAYVFWVHSDLFLMCLVAIALALTYGGSGRWWVVGALLTLVLLSRPPYVGLLLAVALAAPPEGRKKAAIGAAALALIAILAGLAIRGTWTSYGGERRSFYAYTGFPGVDAAAGDWGEQIAERGTHSWVKEETLRMGFDARQAGWNLVYFLGGRHVGILPYFLPLVLGFLAFRPGEGRWALVLAVVLAAAVLAWLRPFNFYGGGGAMANRYFLPLYPALWFLAARPVRPLRGMLAAVGVTVLAAPFLLPLWSAPRIFPLASEGGYRYVSGFARRWLPYETTLSHLKPSGQEDLVHHRLWVRLLTPSLRPEGARLRLAPGEPGEILVGSERPLQGLRVRLPPNGPTTLEVSGAEVIQSIQRPDGGTTLRLRPELRARHRMWWTDVFYLYEIRIGEQPADVLFQILPEPSPPQPPSPTSPSPSLGEGGAEFKGRVGAPLSRRGGRGGGRGVGGEGLGGGALDHG
ncbi:MAG TPA: hypothetical protein VN493_17115 [Thermoanaerobaculia bacterium]|nr:hypothetical protein [Thermoanaerobaculia bacterium]